MKSFQATHTPVSVSWTQALDLRVRTLWFLKMTGTVTGIGVFFVVYFWTMEATTGRAITMPMTAIDRWIGVSELALVPYASLWLYVSLAPAFALNAGALRAYVAEALAIALLGFAVFLLFPTTTPPFGVDWSHYPALRFLKESDAGGNAFPSLHVAFALYSACIISSQLKSIRSPRWARAFNWLWCLAIVYSTIATRQHVVVDIAGGILVACLGRRAAWSPWGRAIWRPSPRTARSSPDMIRP
jgi:membrane-associated phospholipid phosphatase